MPGSFVAGVVSRDVLPSFRSSIRPPEAISEVQLHRRTLGRQRRDPSVWGRVWRFETRHEGAPYASNRR